MLAVFPGSIFLQYQLRRKTQTDAPCNFRPHKTFCLIQCFPGLFLFFCGTVQAYENLRRDALAGTGVTWEDVEECKAKIGTEFIIELKDADEQYILYEIDLLKSNPLVESVSVYDGYLEYKQY